MPTPTYSSVANFIETYPNFVLEENGDVTLNKILVQAERDIDMAIGPAGRQLDTGLKINPDNLDDFRSTSLARAVSHQAMYRLTKGDEFFINFRPESQTGPNGSIIGKEPFIAPQASAELSYGRLYRLVSGHGKRGNPYDLPNQNIDQEPW